MHPKIGLSVLLLLFGALQALAQTGSIKGRVFNEINNEPLAFASVVVQDTQKGTTTDENGKFEISGLEPGLYSIIIEYVGFKRKVVPELRVSSARNAIVEVGMEEESVNTDEVVVKASPFEKQAESPVSKRSIGVDEITRSPGGNRDISNVVSTLPGVASSASFRNDLIIRGGAPNENAFFIDGIEVPNINHFATQGASGGPVGMINVDFIRSVDFYTGAFPVNRSGALSGVLDINFKEGNSENFASRFTVGASEVGLSLEGPIGDDFTYIVSARRSYLQFLFSAVGLPFLPTYTDVNFKFKWKPNEKNHFTLLGIGAIDEFALNLDANETEIQRYILNNLPVNEQYNYTRGFKYTRFGNNSYTNFIFSRYKLNNTSFKYEDNIEKPENLIQNYESVETENQARIENIYRKNGWKLTTGINYGYSTFSNSTYQRINTPSGLDTLDFQSKIFVNSWGLFVQASKKIFKERLSLSGGLRSDANDYSDDMNNLLNQISPRFSASYLLFPRFTLNFNTGIYYQKPPYTVMGYKANGELQNKQNDLTYIQSNHLVFGVEYLAKTNTKLALEGFYKRYYNYPFLLNDSISLANLGSDFGVIGNAPAESSSEGRAYGMEFLVQQKMFKGFYGILAYTLVWSEFTDKNGEFVPSAWDNRHIVSVTAGKKFGKNWELGIRWSFQSGSPYTPYDIDLSSRKPVWDIYGRGLPNYDQLNQRRLGPIHALDFRIDKKWYFNKFNLNLYFDVQNAYNFQAPGVPFLTVERDENGNPVTDPQNPSQYDTYLLDNTNGTLLPTIGIIAEI